MTRHERLSLGVSTAALVISIGSPFLNYYWFQNEVRIRQLKSAAFVAEDHVYGCPDSKTILFDIHLTNTGVWPIGNVQLAIQKTVSSFDPTNHRHYLPFTLDKKNVIPDPLLAISIVERHNSIVVYFKDALPPKSDVMVGGLQLKNVPPDLIYVYPDMETLQPLVRVASEVSSFEAAESYTIDCPYVERLQRSSTMP